MKVFTAVRYTPGALSSLGQGRNVFLRQFNFPLVYDERDRMVYLDHDRVIQHRGEKARECFQRHIGTAEMGLQSWLEKEGVTDQRVLDFLLDLTELKSEANWTGYRITSTVHQGQGFPIWQIEIFAKHPDTSTEVFTGEDAPNVR
jgi:hypothetical protein